MKTLSRYEVRLNLINLVIDSARDLTGSLITEGQQEHLLQLLRIYRTDTIRLMNGRQGTLQYLFENLKVGIRLAASLMRDIQTEEAGVPIAEQGQKNTSSLMQPFYNLLMATTLELSRSIMDIEDLNLFNPKLREASAYYASECELAHVRNV